MFDDFSCSRVFIGVFLGSLIIPIVIASMSTKAYLETNKPRIPAAEGNHPADPDQTPHRQSQPAAALLVTQAQP